MTRPVNVVLLLTAALLGRESGATTKEPPRIDPGALVDLQDYPPYFDALMAELSSAGLSGSETIPGLSVLDEGVRVMPVKVGVSGELAQITALLAGVASERFPFLSRVDELTLGRSEQPGREHRPFRADVMLLAPVRPRQGEPLGDGIAARVAADRRHGEALASLLRGLLSAKTAAPWLLNLRVDGIDVAIEGTIPERTSAEAIVARVVGLEGFVVSEVIGPQLDPESRRTVFLALGRLDARSDRETAARADRALSRR